MLNRLSLFLSLLGWLALSTVSAQTADIQEGCIPLNVAFTPPAGQTGFFWDFKDGATSVLSSPNHVFVTPGVYEVAFRNSPNGPDVGTVTITVYPKPELLVSVDPNTICPGDAVSFSDNSTYPSGVTVSLRSWTLGDGTGASGTNPSHVYSDPGVYTVSLSVTTNLSSCDVTESFVDLVEVLTPPEVAFTTDPDPPASCDLPLTVEFTNTTTGTDPLQYNWSFGNGQTSTNQDPAPITYTAAGNYLIALTATDANGCSATATRIARAGSDSLAISFPDTICLELPFQPENQAPIGTHSWDFGPSASPQFSNSRNPQVFFTEIGTYQVQYSWTNPNQTCSADTTFTIVVEDPELEIVSFIPDHCSAPITAEFSINYSGGTYQWVFGEYGESTAENPVFTYPADDDNFSIYGPRFVTTTLYFQSAGGCRDTLSISDTFNLLTAYFEIEDYDACVGEDFVFEDLSFSTAGIVSWSWHFGDGEVFTTSDPTPPVYQYDTCGIYFPFLVVEAADGCIDTSYTLEVTVCGCVDEDGNGDPGQCSCVPPDPTKPYSICPGDTALLIVTRSPQIKYFRLEGDGFRLWHCPNLGPGVDTLRWVFNHEPGFQDLKLSWETIYGDRDSIFYEDFLEVRGAWSRPYYMIDCSDPYTVMFSDSSLNATDILWEFPGGNTFTDPSFSFTFADTGDYVIYLTATNGPSGCPPDRDSVVVHIRDIQANFSVDPEVCVNEPVPLDASLSQHVNAVCHRGYTWFFPGGQRPRTWGVAQDTVFFTEPCEKDILLEVTDINGCIDTLRKTINVQQVTIEAAIPDTAICLPAQITGTAEAEVICGTLEEITWQIGGISATGEDVVLDIPANALQAGQVVYVNVTATSELGCPTVAVDSVLIYKPVSTISVDPANGVICEGESITFSATDFTFFGSFLDYDWDFGNGQTATGSPTTATFPDPGNYTVSLVYTENATGCRDTTDRVIQVQDFPEAAFTSNVDDAEVLCYPESVFFADASQSQNPLIYQWDFGNGETSSSINPATTYQKGTYTATLIVSTSAGCMDTVARSFTLVGPEGTFSFDKDSICLGESLTLTLQDTVDVGDWLWDFGDGTQQNGGNPVSHPYTFLPPSGSTIATLVLTDGSGTCTYEVLQPVPIAVVEADFNLPSGNFCPGQTIAIENLTTGADSYAWTYSNGGGSFATNPTVTLPNQPGTFTIDLLATNTGAGCVDSFSRSISFGDIELTQIFGDTICPGDTALIGVLDSLPGYTFSWTPGSSLGSPNAPVTTAFPNMTTTYLVFAQDSLGCSAEGEATVVVIPPLPAYPDFDTLVVQGSTVILPGPTGPLFTYTWIPPAGLSCSNCPDPEVTVQDSVTYSLLLSDANGCETQEILFTLRVAPDRIEIPNLFTPNSDGTNDFFQFYVPVGSRDDIGVITMKIYSRWGNLIYDNADPENGWNGTYEGEDCPMDVYAYVIEVEYLDGRTESFRGDLTLIR